MSRSRVSGIVLAIAAIAAIAAWPGRASTDDGSAAVHCAGIVDDQARLTCYDGIFRGTSVPAAVDAATTGAAVGAPASEISSTSPATATDDFGLTPARKESIAAAEAKASDAPVVPVTPAVPDSVTMKVATVAYRLRGELVVITENGQVWVQIDSETKARVREGDEVTIRKGSLGSYLLVTPNHILVRVRRVQ